MKDLYFITGNNNKFIEVQKIIPNLKQLDIDLAEIQSLDPQEVIKHKLQEGLKQGKNNIIVEDTSLFFNNLNGLPGTFTKYFLKSLKAEGLYKLAKSFNAFNATALATVGYAKDTNNIKFFTGEVKGKIVPERLTERSFGWDGIFEVEDVGKTFTQFTIEEKNKYSHRSRAFQKLKKYLQI